MYHLEVGVIDDNANGEDNPRIAGCTRLFVELLRIIARKDSRTTCSGSNTFIVEIKSVLDFLYSFFGASNKKTIFAVWKRDASFPYILKY